MAVPVLGATFTVPAAVFVYLAPLLMIGVPDGPGVTAAPVPRAALTSMRGVTILLRAWVIGLPELRMRASVSSTFSDGKAARSTAAAPATWGVACEVPDMVMPAAVMFTPGASKLRNEAEFEKQATLSASDVASVHRLERRLPTFAA